MENDKARKQVTLASGDYIPKVEAMADQERRSFANMIEILLRESIEHREASKKKASVPARSSVRK